MEDEEHGEGENVDESFETNQIDMCYAYLCLFMILYKIRTHPTFSSCGFFKE